MAEIPQPQHTTVNRIYDAYVAADDNEHRPHLGASVIGEPCERRLWYKFRWALKEVHSGRMLRLFEYGHEAEARFEKNLVAAGCEVVCRDERNEQFRVYDHGGHFGGSCDGIGRGLAEAPKTWHVLEFKTHSAKSFAQLEKVGLEKHKPLHVAQTQVYMGYMELTRSFYLAENKDTDELWSDRIRFDADKFEALRAKALRIIEAKGPLPRISSDPSSWSCKFCEFTPICHGTALPEVNCRTCCHSTPITAPPHDHGKDGGLWHCAVHDGNIPVDFQRRGCDGHRYIPVFAEKTAAAVNVVDGVVVYEVSGGRTFGNGDGSNGTITSAEMRAAGGLDALPECAEIKRQIKTARVVG